MRTVKQWEAEPASAAEADALVPACLPEQRFVRDRLTWTGYLLYGYWSYLWAGFGAFVPYLRSQFQIDYATAALHFGAMSLGPVIAGLIGDKIIRAFGLASTVVSGVVLMLLGLLAVVFGPQVACTIFGAWLIGFGGSIMSQALTISMSMRFGAERAIGNLEIQTMGTVFSLLSPLAIGGVVLLGFDWRAAMLLSLVFIILLACNSLKPLRDIGLHALSFKHNVVGGTLPVTYWLFFGIIFLSVAGEWTVAFWSPEFLAHELHLAKSQAALGMSVFVSAMLIGRIAGRLLLRRLSVGLLLSLSATVAAAGFLLFWLARDLPLNLLGLFIMGLGESNVYPTCLSQALAAAGSAADKAAARMSLSTGGATLCAPLLLGLLADRVGIGQAYGFVAICLIAAAAALTMSRAKCNSGDAVSIFLQVQ